MIGKRQLLASILLVTLIVFSVLNLDMGVRVVRVSAYESPAIYISPACLHTGDPASAIGMDYAVSIHTDYTGSDVWGYDIELTFNPDVLEGTGVVNGDLITEADGPTMYNPGSFNNTAGTLKGVQNSFFASPGYPMPVASGPGILANITFTIVGYGISNITIVFDWQISETRLIGWDPVTHEFNIIDDHMEDHMENAIFYNLLPGDTEGDGDVDYEDFLIFAAAYLKTSGQTGYNTVVDFDVDDDVDYNDFLTFAANYLETYP